MIAYEDLGIEPRQFWKLQLWEFELMRAAALKRQQRQDRFEAQMVANQMNCWLKKPVAVEDLLRHKNEPTKKQDQAKAQVAQARLKGYCRDTSSSAIWQKLEDASRRAEQERGEQKKSAQKSVQP